MAERKIVVPEGMLDAACHAFVFPGGEVSIDRLKRSLEAALRWLSENPIMPTTWDALRLLQERVQSGHLSNEEYCAIPATTIRCVISEWQRRMFLAPEPEVPEAIKDLIFSGGDSIPNTHIIEAYRRGKKAGKS